MTLIELIVGLAIASLMGGVAVAAVYQVLNASTQANNMQFAISQVRTAEHMMTRDIFTAQSVTPLGSNGFDLELIWTDYLGHNHKVEYTLEDMPSGSLKRLQRVYTDPDSNTSTTALAAYIDASRSSSATVSGGAVQVTGTAVAGTYTATRTFEASHRVS
jgi:type II secretory pathway pseudopilin PulG